MRPQHPSNSVHPGGVAIAEIVKLFEQGLSYRSIGNALGIAHSSVLHRLHKVGKRRLNTANADRYRNIADHEIVELFDQGFSGRQIGKQLGMGHPAVQYRLRRLGKKRETPHVTPKELKECRLDPAWEARHGIKNRVVCRICGELKAQIHAHGLHGHLRKHDMAVDDYVSRYPGARLTNFARAAGQAARQARPTTLQQLMEAFAANYLTAQELRECRKDHEWEIDRGITNFVVCRRCGLKCETDLDQHVPRHGYDGLQAYRAEYPGAPWGARDFRRRRGKVRYARILASRARQELKLAEAERKVLNLREDLQKQEAIVRELREKLGRPQTAKDDAIKYRPRLTELRQKKSWGALTPIMNRETGKKLTASGWRHLVEDFPDLTT